jgi:UDP-N-acetylglucosamine 2-epimerase (non-hydrolysing)
MKGVVEANLARYRARWARVIGPGKRLVLVTGHRRESFGAGFEEICEALRELSDRHADTNFVYPVHLNPNVHTVVHQRLGTMKNIHLIDPIAYDDLVYLLSECFLVLTDSGGIQEEAPTLRKPVIVMRDSTERPEAVEAGCAVLAGARRDAIVNAFERISQDENVYRSMTRGHNPYGDGHAAEAIVRICEEAL